MDFPQTETPMKANSQSHDYKNKNIDPESSLEKFSHNAGKKLGDMTSNIANSTTEYVKHGREYVTENPVKGVAIAAVAGAMVGSLLTLSMRRRQS